jgi:hypothetical protein
MFVGMYFMYKVMGRRSMMLFGSAAASVTMLLGAIVWTANPGTPESGKAVIALTILYLFLYNGFSGILSWPLSVEIVSSRLRVITFSLGTGINYFCSCEYTTSSCFVQVLADCWVLGLVSYCTPFFLNPTAMNWGPRYLYIWAASNAITFGKCPCAAVFVR